MGLKRSNKLLIEPPSCATGDIAFNLIVFFLVCASTQPDNGRKQDIPRSDQQQQKQQQESQNIEVAIDKVSTFINGEQVKPEIFLTKLKGMLDTKTSPEDKIVVVKSSDDTPYSRWIEVTGQIDQVGGIVTLQLEEEQTVVTN